MTSPGALELIGAVHDEGSWVRWDEPVTGEPSTPTRPTSQVATEVVQGAP